MVINKFIFIFIFLLITIFLFLYKKKEGFEDKCLFILYGESFREGKQHSRETDTKNGYDSQLLACDSHIKLINKLKQKYNINTDVSISTYDTKYENVLKNMYKNNNLIYKSQKELIGPTNIGKKAFESIHLDKYKFVLFTRNDILIKDKFIDEINPNYDKIMYLSQGSTIFNDCYLDGSPVVNPIIIIVPNKYFNIIHDIELDHNSWKVLYELHNYNKEQMGFILNTYHDADSHKDWNPYYKMVSREESHIFIDEGKENIYLTKNECYNNKR
jgi:hypothetical protein